MFTEIVDWFVDPYYCSATPPNQCGAALGKGTDLASHCVRLALDVAKIKGLSIAIIFVDLSKAFDHALREVVLGWSTNEAAANVAHLVRL